MNPTERANAKRKEDLKTQVPPRVDLQPQQQPVGMSTGEKIETVGQIISKIGLLLILLPFLLLFGFIAYVVIRALF